MTLQIASDLHLDQLTKYSNEKLVIPDGDVLILAGDICNICSIKKHTNFFKYLNKHFRKVIYVPGNHEFYTDDDIPIFDLEIKLLDFLKDFPNVVYLNNDTLYLRDYVITGTCLWWDAIENPNKWFRMKISNEEIKKMYIKGIECIQTATGQEQEKKHIIVTHYPCTHDFKCKPDIWVSGHTHKNFTELRTGVLHVSNQRKGEGFSSSVMVKI